MIHIKDILVAQSKENATKRKFYTNNMDIFSRYFDSEEQYKALIAAGNFRKIDEIIKSKKINY
jgi:hypothetical protein